MMSIQTQSTQPTMNSLQVKLKNTVTSVQENKDTLMLIKTLCDPTKLSVFLLLKQTQELTVSSIAEALDASQSTVSHALSVLKKLGLVECRSCGQLRCYYIKPQTPETQKLLAIFTRTIV